MKLFAATRSKRKFNNPVSFDEERPTRAVEELHQVAATRTERRLFAQVDFRREMRPLAFLDRPLVRITYGLSIPDSVSGSPGRLATNNIASNPNHGRGSVDGRSICFGL
jgi:hypothetical protein